MLMLEDHIETSMLASGEPPLTLALKGRWRVLTQRESRAGLIRADLRRPCAVALQLQAVVIQR